MSTFHKTHIFDMDGLLIDSEPFWRKAEISVFTQYDVPFTEAMCRETVGMRIDEVVSYWSHRFPNLKTKEIQIANEIQDELISLVQSEGNALPGVYDTLQLLKSNDRSVGLASSSSMRIIQAVIKTLAIADYFDAVHSAEFEKQGKPAPDVFLSAAKSLGVLPNKCIVYEDSKNGMLAGLQANMKVVLIPEYPNHLNEWYNQAHLKLNSLEDFDLNVVEQL